MTHARSLCVAVLGQPDEAWLGALLTQLPPDIELIVLDAHARIADSVDVDQAQLRIAANAVLPPFALRRLLAACTIAHEFDVVSACDVATAALNPLPEATTFAGDARLLDAQLWLLGDHVLRPCAADTGALAWVGTQAANRIAAHLPLRHGVCDAVFVTDRDQSLRGPDAPADRRHAHPETALASVRARIAAIVAAPLPAAWPGLDGKPVVLHVLHGWGGGVERFVRDLADGDRARTHLALRALGQSERRCYGEALELALVQGDRLWPMWHHPLSAPIASVAGEHAEWRALFDLLHARFAVAQVMVSSLIGHSLDALATGLPTELVCHDYFPLWPVLHADFGDTSARFDAAALAAAIDGTDRARFPFQEREARFWSALRARFIALVEQHHTVLAAPTRGVRANWLRIAPELANRRFDVIAHGTRAMAGERLLPAPPPRMRMRLAVVGRINGGKGADLLARAIKAGLTQHADVYLVGCGPAGHDFFGIGGVHVLLDYERDELPDLLARIAPDAALLPGTVAESFSYTLSELRTLGLPVIATRLGAFAERIDDGIDGVLVDADADALVALVAGLYDEPGALAAVRETLHRTPVDRQSLDGMASAHRDLLASTPALMPSWQTALLQAEAGVAARALDATRERDALRRENDEQAAELDRRAEWGHALERERQRAEALTAAKQAELTQRERELAQSQHDLGEHRAWVLALDTEVQRLGVELQAAGQRQIDAQREWEAAAAHFQREVARLEGEKAELLGSQSWRLTKPLRFARRQIGHARVQFDYLLRRALGLPPRVLRSLRVRGLKGTIERARGGDAPPALDLPKPELLAADSSQGTGAAPIGLPRSASPRASIVIPVYNKWSYTETCLRSLAKEAQRSGFEVIVVDDGSSDETWERLQQVAGITAHRNAENLGFVGSCNAGAALATGEYLVFLNNDTQVAAHWLDALLDTFDQHPRVGLVGSKLVYPDGRLQEAGGIVFSDGSGWNYGRFGDPRDPAHNYVREVDYCSGAAIAVPRAWFAQRGGFDARYAPAYYEDTDLAFQVREAGLRVLYQPASTVFHFEGVTAGTDTTSGTKKYQVINQQKFLERWAAALAKQPAPGTRIGAAREHRVVKRVLIIDATTPHPDEDSGSVRMVNLMRVLGALGHKVTFFAENRAFDGRYSEALQQLGVEVLYHPWMPEPMRWLRENGAEFDAIVISRHYVAAPLVEAVRHYAPQARLVFDTVDLHYLREEREAALAERDDLRRQAASTKLAELRLIRASDVTLVVSPIEQELLQREAPGARIEVLSNVHEVVGRRTAFAERKDLFFVGGFQHPPNIDAMLWFVHAIWPQVAKALPEVRFHIVGSKMPDAIKALASERVIVHGFLPSLDALLDGCRLSVAPLRFGAGVKGKVNQSMAHGQPVVATTVAAEGMYLQHETDVLVADDADAFAREVIRLYTDEPLWTRLADGGLANIATHFSFAAATQALQRVLG